MTRRLLVIRVIVVLTALLGTNYIVWRWFFSVNWDYWWIAVPLVIAETYSLIDSLLFGFGLWKLKERGEPPVPEEGLTVDVFIATYNEPIELVMETARAAKAIRYPHRSWVLDDGSRDEMRAAAEAEGIGWITRSADWVGMPRHAKAGNLNNALLNTEGEFMLILDADQIPRPEILDRTLGYFSDPKMGLVQTPQYFINVPDNDPLGSQAPLFYGPIQQSKDGWNSAFFCGSNAVLRREALMQLGVSRYVGEIEVGVKRALRAAGNVLRKARRGLDRHDDELRGILDQVESALATAQHELAGGAALFDVTYSFQRSIGELHRQLVSDDLASVRADLEAIGVLDESGALAEVDAFALEALAERDWSPLAAIETVQALVA